MRKCLVIYTRKLLGIYEFAPDPFQNPFLTVQLGKYPLYFRDVVNKIPHFRKKKWCHAPQTLSSKVYVVQYVNFVNYYLSFTFHNRNR